MSNRWESAACEYLTSRGLELVQRNFHARGGEIDLIMRDAEEIVIIEVRHRASDSHGGAAASITPGKRRRIIHAARLWQAIHPDLADTPTRFDVLALEGDRVEWIQDAFSA